MNPLQKRPNPFATRVTKEEENNNVQNTPEPVQTYEDEEFEQEEVVLRAQPAKKQQKRTPVPEVYENNRDKYTSTMDRNIRRSIKVLCAQRGILFATFVEDACREKLRKEGVL